MHRLLDFPLVEVDEITALRLALSASPDDPDLKIPLGFALANAGCTYEAAHLLRPTRKMWKAHPQADLGTAALSAQTWWNKNWRDFARLRHDVGKEAVLNLLGDRAVEYWDLPPLLMHLGSFASEDQELDLARHIFQRVLDLARRGLPKMKKEAFLYVSQASLIDVLLKHGEPCKALEEVRTLSHNPGNAMAHELLTIRVLVANDLLDDAMCQSAKLLVTAEKHRKGYSKSIRQEFITSSEELADLRKRPDWDAMLADPAGYTTGK